MIFLMQFPCFMKQSYYFSVKYKIDDSSYVIKAKHKMEYFDYTNT